MIVEKQKGLEHFKDSSVFGSSYYLKIQSDEFGYVKNNEISLAFYTNENKIIKSLIITDLIISSQLSQSKYTKLMKEIIERLAHDFKIDLLSTGPSFIYYPYSLNFLENVSFGTTYIDLLKDLDLLFSSLHGKHRNVIKKAKKTGVEFEFGKHLKDTCYWVIKKKLDSEGIYFESFDLYNKLIDSLEGKVEFFIVKYKGEIQGAAVIPYNLNCAYYLWGGSIDNPLSGSINFLQWEIISHFKSLGVLKYDFVGIRKDPPQESKLYGIKRFKIRFGGEIEYGYRYRYIISPLKFKIFRLLFWIKNKQKYSDIADQ